MMETGTTNHCDRIECTYKRRDGSNFSPLNLAKKGLNSTIKAFVGRMVIISTSMTNDTDKYHGFLTLKKVIKFQANKQQRKKLNT